MTASARGLHLYDRALTLKHTMALPSTDNLKRNGVLLEVRYENRELS